MKYAEDEKKLEPGSDSIQTDKALVHDPEKWEPVFGQDHAQAKS
jgi:hypothetical protein